LTKFFGAVRTFKSIWNIQLDFDGDLDHNLDPGMFLKDSLFDIPIFVDSEE